MSASVLPIVCAIDDCYVLPLAVMLESLKQHLHSDYRPVLYLIHAGISAPNLSIISSLVETNSITPTDEQILSAPQDSHFPREASFPLLLPELLPAHLERVLFLDADLLIMKNLANLWQTPMGACVLAAAPDSAVPVCSAARGVKGWQARGIPSDAPYFNGGVLLIHLERWREREVNRRVRQYFAATREPIDFLHQEALNAVLWNDWKQLDPRWNLLASLAGRSYEQANAEAWRQPGIVHFAGRMKPWRSPIGGPFDEPYREVLERILPLIPREPPSFRDEVQSVYDRYLRNVFYPIERSLWRQRIL